MNIEKYRDDDTGLTVRNTYLSGSGFNAIEGFRQFGSLSIREAVVKGVAITFLTHVKVFSQDNTLIIDVAFKERTSYSRERVRTVVLNELVKMLVEAAAAKGRSLDEYELHEKLDNELKAIYYQESYHAILDWASEIGININ